ncbi:MAG: hypothetical protein H6907_07365 [Hyphomicrobiales bacterium]|nr:hypothetical protein [Hyphomicrobiales bacterium]MCP5371541.1 hypothetical protein [Hyphomicrobiales bacterium]
MRPTALTVLLLLLAAAVPAAGSESAPPAADGPPRVQLAAFMAPLAQSKLTSARATPLSLILTVAEGADVGDLCQISPRLRDALLAELYERPIPVDRHRRPDLTGLDERFRQVINGVVGTPAVASVLVMHGAKSLGGGAAAKLPFTQVLGCRAIGADKGGAEPAKPAH